MGGKEGLRPQLFPVRAVFQHRLGDAHAVKGAGAPPDLVQNKEAPAGGVLQDVRHLSHFHHEGGLPRAEIVAGPDAGKDPVHHPDPGRPGGHEGPHLGHQRDEGHLPHVGGFSRHVGPGDDGDPVLLLPHIRIIGHKQGGFQHLLHHGMPPVVDLDNAALVHHRAAVPVLRRHGGQ